MDWKSAVHFQQSMLKHRYNLMSELQSQFTTDLSIVLLKLLGGMASLDFTEVLAHCCMDPFQRHQSGKVKYSGSLIKY